MKPKDADDMRFAARLITEGLASQELVQQILTAQGELIDRGKPMTVAQICIRKKWLTRAEARFYLADDHVPADLVGGYTIERELGAGGMSRVFRARRAAEPSDVALKVLRPSLARDDTQRERFLHEGRLLCRLDHENIVKGYDVVEADGLHAVAMELVPGVELLQLIDQGHLFNEDAALYVVLQIARAIGHMAAEGLVHRDIKPGNILITPDNTIKLCDLGLAGRVGVAEEAPEITVGTVAYIAPEQARGESPDVRSDIYSLGVTLYQLVVGEVPFEGDDDRETLAKRFFESLKSSKLAVASPHMHYFIQKMMATDPDHRYQSAEELIADIEEQIRGKKTLKDSPRGSGAPQLAKPFAERKKAPVSKKRRRR